MTTAAEARKEKQDKVAARKKKRANDLKEGKNGEGSSEEAPETEEAEVATEEAVAEDGPQSTE